MNSVISWSMGLTAYLRNNFFRRWCLIWDHWTRPLPHVPTQLTRFLHFLTFALFMVLEGDLKERDSSKEMWRWPLGLRKDNTEFRGEHAAAVRTLSFQPTSLTKNKEAIGNVMKISGKEQRESIPCGISRVQKVEATDPLLLWSPGRRRLPFKRCSNLFCRRLNERGRSYRMEKNSQNRGSRCYSEDGEDWEKGKRTRRVDHL